MDKLSALGTRFRDYLRHRNIGINQAGRDLGVSGAQVSNITKGKNFSLNILFKIIDAYADLRLEWLLLGEGDMLRRIARPKSASSNAPLVSEGRSNYRREASKLLEDCHRERDQLQIQVATYRDALDRLGRSGLSEPTQSNQ